jgi:hypothetical protein
MKRRNFTLSIRLDIIEFIKQVEQCPQYAWIIHDKDINHETGELIEKHVHAYVEFPNPRSFKSVAELLNVPENQVQKVIDKNGILQYLIHKNQPEKYQYDFNDITSNFDLEPFFMNKSNNLWEDYNRLRTHQISPDEFYHLHKSEIDNNGFFQKLRIFEMIANHTEVIPLPTKKPDIHTLLKKDDTPEPPAH